MFCKNCGKELSDDVLYCPNCGEEISKTEVIDNITVTTPEKTKFNPTSLILGICGLIGGILLALIGYVLTIPGLIIGIKQKNVPGIVINAIGLTVTVINSILGVIANLDALKDVAGFIIQLF